MRTSRGRRCRCRGLRTGFAFPIVVGADVVAELEFYTTEPATLDEEPGEVLVNIGTQLGRVIERERAEGASRRLAAMVENSPDLVAVAELDGSMILLNSAGQSLVEMAGPEAIAGTRLRDFFPPDDREFVDNSLIPAAVDTGRSVGELEIHAFEAGSRIKWRSTPSA